MRRNFVGSILLVIVLASSFGFFFSCFDSWKHIVDDSSPSSGFGGDSSLIWGGRGFSLDMVRASLRVFSHSLRRSLKGFDEINFFDISILFWCF